MFKAIRKLGLEGHRFKEGLSSNRFARDYGGGAYETFARGLQIR
jgi:hypothetical protein